MNIQKPVKARRLATLVLLVTLVAGACSTSGGGNGTGGGTGGGGGSGGGGGTGGGQGADDAAAAKGKVVVFAASSLSEVYEKIAADVEASSDIDVELNVAGSQQLVAQLAQGASADVLATADQDSMDAAKRAGVVQGNARIFARNELVIIVSAGNPKDVRGVADLAKTTVRVAVAAPEVPAGRYAKRLFEGAGVQVKPVTEELSVKGVVTKVALGEVDAGIVYVTDAKARTDVEQVALPPSDIEVEYPIARTANGRNRAAARAFIDGVTGDIGRRHLIAAGFVV